MTEQTTTNDSSIDGAASALDDGLEGFEAWWVEHGQYCRAGGGDYEKTFAFRAWQAATSAERERICTAIKAEDDHCADGDYMLDSDDCIAVAQGRWQRPDWNFGQPSNLNSTTRPKP